MPVSDWDALCWTGAQLPQALAELATTAGLTNASVELTLFKDSDDGAWIEWAAKRLGCEAEPLEIRLCDLKAKLAGAYPSLLRIDELRYLAILHANSRRVLVLTPNLTRKRVELRAVAQAIREQFADPNPGLQNLLRDAGLRGRSLTNSVAQLSDDRSMYTRWSQCWVFCRAPGGKTVPLLRELGALQNGSGLVAAHVIQYLLLVASWALLGRFSFNGRADQVWLYAWALILFTLLPFQVLATWLQDYLALGSERS